MQMNKIKCWKEQTTKTQKEYGGYNIWRKTGTNIQIAYSDQSLNGGPKNNVSVFGIKRDINKDFKNKKSAIKFAKKYMKEHDKC